MLLFFEMVDMCTFTFSLILLYMSRTGTLNISFFVILARSLELDFLDFSNSNLMTLLSITVICDQLLYSAYLRQAVEDHFHPVKKKIKRRRVQGTLDSDTYLRR